ncbi:putative reverse transcriptase domain-containing protein [Tanacetum coccineum]
MSTSTTHQQSLADSGYETRPLMLKRGSYIPWASRFRRYLNRKRDNRKWLNKAIDEGPYEFKEFTPSESEPPRMQKEEDLTGGDLKHYEAKIEAMNLILISIPNDIYNSMDACNTAQAMRQRVKCLMRGILQNKVDRETRFNNEFDQFVAEPGEALVSVYNQEIIEGNNVQNDAKNLRRTLRTTSSGSAANVQCYNCSENGHYARNFLKPKVRDSKYFMEQMLLVKYDEAVVTLTDEQNDFLVADATRMEEIKELSANICLMAKIQPANIDSDTGQAMILHFSVSNIIFDEPNVDVNSDSVEYNNNVQASYELEQLARNAYKEAEKQQINANKVKQQNKVLTQQLELYKEKVRVFKMTKGDNETFFNEFIEAD